MIKYDGGLAVTSVSSLSPARMFTFTSVTFTIEGSGVNWVSKNGETYLEIENGNEKIEKEYIYYFNPHKPDGIMDTMVRVIRCHHSVL